MLSGIGKGKPENFWRVKEIAAHLSIGISTWWRWVKTGKAPQGIKLGSRVTVWRVSEVMDLVDSVRQRQI